MEKARIEEKIVFDLHCPYLNKSVRLKRDTWYGKIVRTHDEVGNRLDLIREILTKDAAQLRILKKRTNPNKISIFKECPHLLPYNKYIKIALEFLSDTQAVVTTVHGVNNLPLDMEEIK